MWSMASRASLRLHRNVLEHERPARLHMALGTDLVLIDCGFQVVLFESAMHVMAVAAGDCAFVHRVVKRHSECTLHVTVAAIAEHRFGSLEQAGFAGRLMDAMAADAAYVGLGVR